MKMKPSLSGTPWKNFKYFLIKMRDWYEDIARTGTGDQEPEKKKNKCGFCQKRGHTEDECRMKQQQGSTGERRKRTCFK